MELENIDLARKCPICSNISELICIQKFTLPENFILPKVYNIVGCKKCGFVYADSIVNQRYYDRYYEEQSKYESNIVGTGNGVSENDKKRLKNTAKVISQYVTDKQSKILDIGCANGGLLKELRELGYMSLTGMDPSPVCVQNVRNEGINAVQGSIFSRVEDIDFKGEKFELIILSNVLEHIYDINSAFRNVIEMLNDDGIIYIEGPDASRYPEYYIVPYYYFDIEHINHFTLNDINNLAFINSLNVIAHEEILYEVGNNLKYPSLYQILKRNKVNNVKNINYSSIGREKVKEFVHMSQNDKRFDEKINAYIKSQEEIVIWGAGMNTYRLLANTDLSKCNILAFIDNDCKKQGNILNSKGIYSSELLNDYKGTVLLCSAFNNEQIKNQLKRMNVKNKIDLL
jgi:SAM-dependent methyltransferase